MASLYVYYTSLFLLVVASLGLAISFLSLIYSSFSGSPYVPINKREIDKILKKARLQKGETFLELGSGDGRVVRSAARDFQVKGNGIEINPLLIYLSRLHARFQKLEDVTFRRQDIFEARLQNANTIFLFLMPKILQRLKGKIEKESHKGTLIISHGFRLNGWESRLIDHIDDKPFPTYFYRI